MLKIKSLLLILAIFQSWLFSQIPSPYYQSFDYEFNFWGEGYENKYVLGTNILMYDLQRWAPRERTTYFSNYWYISDSGELVGNPHLPLVRQDLKPQNEITWNEPERMEFVMVKGRKGKSIKLTTLDQYDNAGGIEDTVRSRTEIMVKPQHGEGAEYYYSWSFMIPDNGEHPDDITTDNIIAQWHEPIDKTWNLKNVQPPFFLTYKNDLKSKDNFRKLGVMYGLRYDDNNDGKNEGGYHSFPIDKSIEKGRWNDVILHIKWSSKPNIGFLEIWINGKQVSYQGKNKFYAANLYTDISGNTYPNFFKMGQYRQGQTTTQSIYIDDFRIGKTLEEVNARLQIKNCEKEINASKGDRLEVNEVTGADNYQFYFVNIDKIISSRNPFLKIKKKWIVIGEIHEVKARVGVFDKKNKEDGFGQSCYFRTVF